MPQLLWGQLCKISKYNNICITVIPSLIRNREIKIYKKITLLKINYYTNCALFNYAILRKKRLDNVYTEITQIILSGNVENKSTLYMDVNISPLKIKQK